VILGLPAAGPSCGPTQRGGPLDPLGILSRIALLGDGVNRQLFVWPISRLCYIYLASEHPWSLLRPTITTASNRPRPFTHSTTGREILRYSAYDTHA